MAPPPGRPAGGAPPGPLLQPGLAWEARDEQPAGEHPHLFNSGPRYVPTFSDSVLAPGPAEGLSGWTRGAAESEWTPDPGDVSHTRCPKAQRSVHRRVRSLARGPADMELRRESLGLEAK